MESTIIRARTRDGLASMAQAGRRLLATAEQRVLVTSKEYYSEKDKENAALLAIEEFGRYLAVFYRLVANQLN